MMKKWFLVVVLVLTAILFTGCEIIQESVIFIESYNNLKNPNDKKARHKFIFEYNSQTYEVMSGQTANRLRLIDKDEENQYQVIMLDEDQNEVLSLTTDPEYYINSVRECTDTDGTVYIMYSKFATDNNQLLISELKGTYVLEIDMDSFQVKKQHDFGVQTVVLSIYDGYVYTLEDGKIYRRIISEAGKRECMVDLIYRRIPYSGECGDFVYRIKPDGIQVSSHRNIFQYGKNVIADMKYTDSPIEL